MIDPEMKQMKGLENCRKIPNKISPAKDIIFDKSIFLENEILS